MKSEDEQGANGGETLLPEGGAASLRHAMVRVMFRPLTAAALANIVAACFLSLLLWDIADRGVMQYWLAMMIGTQAALIIIGTLYRRAGPGQHRRARWPRLFVAATLVGGLLWGIGAGGLMFPAGMSAYQFPLLMLLASVATSSLLLHQYTKWLGPFYMGSVLLPLAVSHLREGGPASAGMAAGLALFTVILMLAHRELRRSSVTVLAQDLENQALRRDKLTYQTYFEQARQLAQLSSWELDLKSGELSWSDEAFAMFGMEPGQKLTKDSVLGALYWGDRQSYVRALEKALKSRQPISREFRVVLADGSLRVLRDVGEIVEEEEGNPGRMLGVMFDVTGLVTAEKKTKSVYREFTRIISHMQDTYYRADPAGRLTHVSRSMEKLLGYRPGECIGMRIADLYAVQRHGQSFLADLHAHGGSLRNYEIQMQHKDKGRIWVSVNAQFISNDKQNTIGIEGTIRDINELKQAQMALHQEKELALVTLQSIGDGVVTTDESGQVQYLNPTAERLLGYDNGSASGRHYQSVLRLVDEKTSESLGDLVRLCLSLENGSAHADEGLLIQGDGSRYHLKVTAAPMRDHFGHVVGAVLVLHDITEVMGMARQLSYQASHDMLTGLKNRPAFEKRVEEAIRSAQSNGEVHALFYMDLDQFKVVNDTCGHKAGDELLQQVAALMEKKVRETDVLARLGGDEFGVLLERCPLGAAEKIAEAIRVAVRDFRFAWEDKAFEIGISIGVVPIGADSGNLAHVLAAADAACYVAKDSGRNRLHVYQPDDGAVLQRHGEMQWVHRLSSAFDSNRFQLYAQPVAHVAGDRVVSHYEILVRMKDEGGRLIPPGAFIPAAERYNLMPMIDRWVIKETLMMLRQAQGELAFPPVECAINLSGQSLCDGNFLDYVVDLFDETGIPCEGICFEVTETAAVANLSRATRFISVLRGMGCSFALDDFGSGLSSFGYLKSLPIDYLKIDGGFVRDMVRDKVDRAMVESINEIGHIMGLKTIAEYAEDESVLEALDHAGVDFAQGYGIAPPIPFDVILERETRQQHIGVSKAS